MKKIGIITITRNQNYGNKLQNYAVQEVLKKLGFETETILNSTKKGFKTPISFLSKIKKINPFYILKVIQVRLKNRFYIKNSNDKLFTSILWEKKYRNEILKAKKDRVNAFSVFFKRHIVQSSFTISLDDLKLSELHKFDYFVCGSDQVWNPNYPQNSSIEFLQFTEQSKRIAFSPSFGVSEIPESKKSSYAQWLNEIPHLSVREDQGAKIIKDLTGRDATVLVDPTLMLNKQQWLNIAKKPDLDIEEKYILTYFLGNQTAKYRKHIQKVAKESSCAIINLNDIHEMESYKVDPSGFLYLINHAFLVCTDSFHGMVLSIILNSEFIAFDRVEDGKSMGSRVDTLLNKFQLTHRHFNKIQFQEKNVTFDYKNINSIIESEQHKTYTYFSNIFESHN
jgi:hypothetical protein